MKPKRQAWQHNVANQAVIARLFRAEGRPPAEPGKEMARKFIIVNNGLRDLRGHYFETSVSVAEAARAHGCTPILAAHVDCPAALIPSWLEFYPLFCTDHWMAAPGRQPPDLRGIRGDAAALARIPVEALLDGQATLGEYLRARFDPVPFPEPPLPEPPLPEPPPPAAELPAPTPPASVAELPAPSRPPWKHYMKGALRGLVPPLFVPALRRWWRGRAEPGRVARRVLRVGLPPVAYTALRKLYRGLHQPDLPPVPSAPEPPVVQQPPVIVVAAPPPPASPPPVAVAAPRPDPLSECLARVGATEEFAHLCSFQRDLERLLCLTGATCRDHVFLPTAHGRELLAVQRLIASLPPEVTPTFHLEFRHALDMGITPENPHFVHPYTTVHGVYFDFFRRQPLSPHLRLYTDTPELSEAYAEFSGLDFGSLPIPFRTNFVTAEERPPKGQICIAFLGDVRDEKGFHWLPELVDALKEDYLLTGKVRFLVQGTLVQPEWNPKSHQALQRLKETSAEHVQLVGLDGPISPVDYYQMVREADLLLCPYDALAYHRRSSGTLTEAIAAGIPTVVPRDTWLARQQPLGAGESCSDVPSFIEAVRRICDNYPRYLREAVAAKERWLAIHTPQNLVTELLRSAEAAVLPTSAVKAA